MKYRANGKLLLTGEYFVLKGARALAVPTLFGQTMEIKTSNGSEIRWSAVDDKGNEWFTAVLDLFNFRVEKCSNEKIGNYLEKLIRAASRLNSDFLSQWKKYKVKTELDFDPSWGLGSSSTLTFLVAEWAELNPFELYFELFNGSGYDIACAYADGPVMYQYTGESIELEEIDFNPSFRDRLYFVYSGRKQSTEEALKSNGRGIAKIKAAQIEEMNQLTDSFINCKNFDTFCELMDTHEQVVSSALGLSSVKMEKFDDFEGSIKSLGAWGGDFYLAASALPQDKIESYFSTRGVGPIIPFEKMVLQPTEN